MGQDSVEVDVGVDLAVAKFEALHFEDLKSLFWASAWSVRIGYRREDPRAPL